MLLPRYHIKKNPATAHSIRIIYGEHAYQEYKQFGKLPVGYDSKTESVTAYNLPVGHPHRATLESENKPSSYIAKLFPAHASAKAYPDGFIRLYTKTYSVQFYNEIYWRSSYYEAEQYKITNELPKKFFEKHPTIKHYHVPLVDSNGVDLAMAVPEVEGDFSGRWLWPDGSQARFVHRRSGAHSASLKLRYGDEYQEMYRIYGLMPLNYPFVFHAHETPLIKTPPKNGTPKPPKPVQRGGKAHRWVIDDLPPADLTPIRRAVSKANKILIANQPGVAHPGLHTFVPVTNVKDLLIGLSNIFKTYDREEFRYVHYALQNAVNRIIRGTSVVEKFSDDELILPFPQFQDGDLENLTKIAKDLVEALPSFAKLDFKKEFIHRQVLADSAGDHKLLENLSYGTYYSYTASALSKKLKTGFFETYNRKRIKDFLDDTPRFLPPVNYRNKFLTEKIIDSGELVQYEKRIVEVIKDSPDASTRAAHYLQELDHWYFYLKTGWGAEDAKKQIVRLSSGAAEAELEVLNDLSKRIDLEISLLHVPRPTLFPHFVSLTEDETDQIRDLMAQAAKVSTHSEIAHCVEYRGLSSIALLPEAQTLLRRLIENASNPKERQYLVSADKLVTKWKNRAFDRGYLTFELCPVDKAKHHITEEELEDRVVSAKARRSIYIDLSGYQFHATVLTDDLEKHTDRAYRKLAEKDAVQNKVDVSKALADRLRDDEDFLHLCKHYGRFFLGRGEWHKDDKVRHLVANLVSQWAGSSTGTNAAPNAIQRAAAEEFGIEIRSGIDAGIGWRLTDEIWQDDRAVRGLRSFLRTMYNITQEAFAEIGVTHVWAWRGFKFADTVNPFPAGFNLVDNFNLNPISAFSFGYKTSAQSFCSTTGALISARIPVARILSTFATGFGCTGEEELVVIASNEDDMAWANARQKANALSRDQYLAKVKDAFEKHRAAIEIEGDIEETASTWET